MPDDSQRAMPRAASLDELIFGFHTPREYYACGAARIAACSAVVLTTTGGRASPTGRAAHPQRGRRRRMSMPPVF